MSRLAGIRKHRSAIIVAILVVGGVIWHRTQDPIIRAVAAMSADLTNAQQRWQAARIDHYRLTIGYFTPKPVGSCMFSVEVRSEKVVHVSANTCEQESPRPISALFQEMQTYIKQHGRKDCARFTSCTCLQVDGVDAIYDEHLGYPLSVTFGPSSRYIDLQVAYRQQHQAAYRQPLQDGLHRVSELLSAWPDGQAALSSMALNLNRSSPGSDEYCFEPLAGEGLRRNNIYTWSTIHVDVLP